MLLSPLPSPPSPLSPPALHSGLRAVALSLDDFYLTGAEQDALALGRAGDPPNPNPLLKLRGNAGTHDMQLMQHTMHALRDQRHSSSSSSSGGGSGSSIQVPRYDKSLRRGRGDRAPPSEWLSVPATEPVDVVLFEGWMLGFAPLAADELHPYRYGVIKECEHHSQP